MCVNCLFYFFFPLTTFAVYFVQIALLQVLRCGYLSRVDDCLLSNIMELDGKVVLCQKA